MRLLELSLATVLAFATGVVVGVSKLLQVLATTEGGRFATSSEAVAEQFLVAFGLAKAVGNLIAGAIADAYGRRVCMACGWAAGAIFSALVLIAKSWAAVVLCDLLLGLNQALCWSAALFIAHDVLEARRGVASGLIETSGYAAIALMSPAVDVLGVEKFDSMHAWLLALSIACAALTAMALSETKESTMEGGGGGGSSSSSSGGSSGGNNSSATISTSSRRFIAFPSDPALRACCLVGLCLNLTTAYAWGAMSRWLAAQPPPSSPWPNSPAVAAADAVADAGDATPTHYSFSVGSVLLLYSIPKGALQLLAGLLADSRWCCGAGAPALTLTGLLINTLALLAFAALIALQPFADPFAAAAPLAFALGAGTACAYSPVLACVAARTTPDRRATALSAYRFWRDLGFAAGAILLGHASDSAGGALWVAPCLAAVLLLVAAAVFASVYRRVGEHHSAGEVTFVASSACRTSALTSATRAAAGTRTALSSLDSARERPERDGRSCRAAFR